MLTYAELFMQLLQLIHNGHHVSRHTIRHALSMLAPLGTLSCEIDLAASNVCELLVISRQVYEVDGVFYPMTLSTPAAVTDADSPDLN